jgi:GTPase
MMIPLFAVLLFATSRWRPLEAAAAAAHRSISSPSLFWTSGSTFPITSSSSSSSRRVGVRGSGGSVCFVTPASTTRSASGHQHLQQRPGGGGGLQYLQQPSSSSSSALHVMVPPDKKIASSTKKKSKSKKASSSSQKRRNNKFPSLFPLENESDDDAADDSSMDTSSVTLPFFDVLNPENEFYDEDSSSLIVSDVEAASQEFYPEVETMPTSSEGNGEFAQFEREEASILEEREARLFVDEFGIQRRIETCILIGVEDVTQRRKDNRKQLLSEDDVTAMFFDDSLSSRPKSSTDNDNSNNDVYFTLDESMTEMRELVRTAGMEIVGEITQRLNEVNPKTYIGTGKVTEAMDLLKQLDSCTVVFDAELTPRQQKHLENIFNKQLLQNDFLGQEAEIKVLDRTALILDIFAQHAKTREGKLQVDLALHEYRKPRLTKMWTHLERQSGAGGVGLRGPGESQLEIDKRLLRDRITVLQQKIDDVQKHRTMHRRGRERLGLPLLSLVGYTNAGKSSLLNYLTKAGVMAESILFATLDPTTRKVQLPGYKTHPQVLMTDTVGFIQKLPTQLVAAFRATLEEVQDADVLIHVIDVSNPTWRKQERAVLSVLQDIGAAGKPIVRVLNKMDLLDPIEQDQLQYETSIMNNDNAKSSNSDSNQFTVAVSALTGFGLQDFVAVVEEALTCMLVPIVMELPYALGQELSAIHEQGHVQVIDYRSKGTYVEALVPRAIATRLDKYSVPRGAAPTHDDSSSSYFPTNANKNEGNPSKNGEEDEIDWAAIGRGRH